MYKKTKYVAVLLLKTTALLVGYVHSSLPRDAYTEIHVISLMILMSYSPLRIYGKVHCALIIQEGMT